MCRFRVWLQALKTRNPAEKEKEKDLQAVSGGFRGGFQRVSTVAGRVFALLNAVAFSFFWIHFSVSAGWSSPSSTPPDGPLRIFRAVPCDPFRRRG